MNYEKIDNVSSYIIIWAMYLCLLFYARRYSFHSETYVLKTVEYKGEQITDYDTLVEMAEAIENYQNMPRPTETPSNIDYFVDLKIIGPITESKPTLLFGEDFAVCYWSTSVGIYEIVDGDILYQELVEIIENNS